MERLTVRVRSTTWIKGFEATVRGKGIDKFVDAVDRLAAYEDTNLTPEQVAALVAENAALRADNERKDKELAGAVEDITEMADKMPSGLACYYCAHNAYGVKRDNICKSGKGYPCPWEYRGLAGREGTE